jgi:hypothetical protein
MDSFATTLHRNPFYVLGASTRDDRRRLVQLSEEKVLELDQGICEKARSDLTSPRNRLAAETAWLPGVAPSRAIALVNRAAEAPQDAWNEGLPALAHANLLAATLELGYFPDGSELATRILQFSTIVHGIDAEDVLRDINEDRAVAGFPEVQGVHLVGEQIQARRRTFRNAIKAAVDRLPSRDLVDAVTKVVEYATGVGKYHAPELIDELVDTYQIEAQDFLQREAENIDKLIAAARQNSRRGEESVAPIIEKLATVTRNWDRVAQPIQLSFMASGKQHPASNEVAYAIRGLAVDLFNEHDMLGHAQRLTSLLKDVFAKVPAVVDQVEEDAEALEGIFAGRRASEARREEWARSITYATQVGTVFKKTLSISPSGVSWDGRTFPLERVTRIRWGGVRHSVNGIPSGTSYTIGFGDDQSEAVMEIRDEEVYSKFVDKLYRAVGVRLLTELLETVRHGPVSFGDAVIWDAGISLAKQGWFSGNERVKCRWRGLRLWSADGSFYMGAHTDKKAYTGLSYIHTPNTHLLEQAVRMAHKRGCVRLSELLQDG